MDYDYDHPEHHQKGLIFAPSGIVPEEVREARKGLPTMYDHQITTELCRACGWNSYHELFSGYDPRVKICYSRNNIGLWAIGRRWALRDQPNDGTFGNDYMTQ